MTERRDSAEPLRGPSAAEQAELEALAAELRASVAPTPLSSGFAERLDLRLSRAWTLRAAMDRNPVLRVAAGLLVLVLAGAPLAALVGLLPGWPGRRPDLGFDAPALPPAVETPVAQDVPPVVPPFDSDDLLFTPEWRQALERANRMALAGASWAAAGRTTSVAAAEAVDWQAADAAVLAAEFERRCARGIALPPEPALEARVRELAAQGGDPRLAGWLWVLDGVRSRDAAGWEGAPFFER
jgi:hypothetical protein